MDPHTKSAIKSLVLDLRHTLEDELAIALKRYGLFTDRAWSLDSPPDRLTTDADRETWHRIVAAVRRGMKEGRTLPQASADYVRESAFTFLNRLVGLKCLEVRGIIAETITTRDVYGGRSKAHRDYRDEHPQEMRAPDDALPACLAAVCHRVNDELIGYLFDPDDDHSLVWPRYAVLRECIEKINALDEAAWREDEITGWLYQFYNAEEKVAIRKRGKPQTPHDVAVINQFFTPRWIVKFLVDNTLGRLWLEMHPDSRRVREKCSYLVPEPLPSEQIGKSANQYIVLDPDSPINNPNAAPRRAEKPVTHIRLIDPACGTMHFGHYACEVFEAMYRDARDWGHLQIEDHEIPGAILEHNLFGVDIDRRAVQLAALSLLMKARTMHPQARVRQVNLVVADATLPDSGIKDKFLARYANDRRVQRAFAQVLDDLDHVAQVGSLLRVDERLRELLARAGHAAVSEGLDALSRQRELPGMEPEVRQMGLAELVEEEQAVAWTPHYTLQELRDDLRTFARQALQEHDVNAQLFATEADKAMHLLDVLMNEYDVVVMNPPYGGTTVQADRYLKTAYPETGNDLYAAFVERASELLRARGFVGSLTSRTFLHLRTFASLRKRLLADNGGLVTLAELGIGVLDDATVRPSAYVLKGPEEQSSSQLVFFGLRQSDNRQAGFEKALTGVREGYKMPDLFIVNRMTLRSLPGYVMSYWISDSLAVLFDSLPPLDRDVAYGPPDRAKIADVKAGLCTGQDAMFVRSWWELGEKGRPGWYPFNKGGSFSRYYSDVDLVVDWRDDGYVIRNLEELHGLTGARVQNEKFYFREGLIYPYICDKGLSVRHHPAGRIFAHGARGIFPCEAYDLWSLLGILNSKLLEALLQILTVDRKHETGILASLPIAADGSNVETFIAECARTAHDLKATWDTGNEICTRFTVPWLVQISKSANRQIGKSGGREDGAEGIEKVLKLLGEDAPEFVLTDPPTLDALLDVTRAIETAADARLQSLQAHIDDAVYDLYEISPADRALIERELGDRPPELVWPQMERRPDQEKRREHVRRFFSYFARQAVRESESGIVPLAGCAAREPYLVDRIRAQLEAQFGPAVAYQLEQDAAPYLGRPLEEWLRRDYFARFHVKLYKNRPILWHLASPKGYFAVLVDYHRLTHDTLLRVQTLYLWPQMEEVRTRLAAARTALLSVRPAVKAIADLEDELADLEECNARLERVIQGAVEVDLPEWANGPYRNGAAPYNPDLDDGVRVNLLPVQEAGLLPVRKVV